MSLEELVDIELSKTLTYLVVASNGRRTGDVAVAIREELSAHRAYQEALHLFRVLRDQIGQAGARRLALRVKKMARPCTKASRSRARVWATGTNAGKAIRLLDPAKVWSRLRESGSQ